MPSHSRSARFLSTTRFSSFTGNCYWVTITYEPYHMKLANYSTSSYLCWWVIPSLKKSWPSTANRMAPKNFSLTCSTIYMVSVHVSTLTSVVFFRDNTFSVGLWVISKQRKFIAWDRFSGCNLLMGRESAEIKVLLLVSRRWHFLKKPFKILFLEEIVCRTPLI